MAIPQRVKRMIVEVNVHIEKTVLLSLVNAATVKVFVHENIFIGNKVKKILEACGRKVIIQLSEEGRYVFDVRLFKLSRCKNIVAALCMDFRKSGVQLQQRVF